MTSGDPCSASDDLHGIADEAIGGVVHAEGRVEIGQRGHLVLWKLFLHRAQEGPVCCPVLFKLPPESTHAESRAEPAPELFILAQDLQTTLQSGDHDCESGFLDLLLQPVSNVVHNTGPLD